MIVIPTTDRFDASKVVARAPAITNPDGTINDKWKGLMCFFDREAKVPEVGKPLEVMITGVRYKVDEQNPNYVDHTAPRFLFIRAVTDNDVLINHSGFSTSGSMCCTTADAYLPDGKHPLTLTPGRVGVVTVGFNNADFLREPRPALIQGQAYVKAQDLKKSPVRIEGVPDWSQMRFNHYGAEGIE